MLRNKQKEIIQKEKFDLKTTKNKLKEIKQEEDRNKFQESLEKLRKQQDLLAKVQSKCNIRDIKDLVSYQGYLDKTNEQLSYQSNLLELEKQQKLQKLHELKTKLNAVTLYNDWVEERNKVKIEHTLECLASGDAYVQPHVNDYVNEKKVAEIEIYKFKIKGLHNLLTNCIMLIYRISWQLREEKNITKETVATRLSSVGLRLEHMVATLTK